MIGGLSPLGTLAGPVQDMTFRGERVGPDGKSHRVSRVIRAAIYPNGLTTAIIGAAMRYNYTILWDDEGGDTDLHPRTGDLVDPWLPGQPAGGIALNEVVAYDVEGYRLWQAYLDPVAT